jgi:hypothetical protein
MHMPLVELISSLGVGTFLGTIGGYEYRKRREKAEKKRTEIEEWFDDSLDIIGRAAYNIERALYREDADYERILEELDGFSERLFTKSRNPPDGAPDPAIESISSIARLYAKASIVAEVRTEKEGTELLVELFELAQQEFTDELDLGNALEDATEVSDLYEQIVSQAAQAGVDTGEIADTAEGILNEWDPEDFAQFVSGASSRGSPVQSTVQHSMKLFFDLAKAVSNSSYDDLQLLQQDL